MNDNALSGIRVLDLSRLLPGPYCTMMLGDLGAEIIKIEDPYKGDYLRNISPFVCKESAYFLAVNRNKKSIILNLKQEDGKRIFLELVKKSDVVIEGFRPGVMKKMGLDYEELKKVNPRIIFCSISGYGQTGPYAEKAGHDINYLSLAGVMSFTGDKSGKPAIPGIQIADIGGGAMLAAFCVLAAIIWRQKSGKGQYIDVSMMDGAISWLSMYAGKYFADNNAPKPSNEMLNGRYAFYNIYSTKDNKYMSLGALERRFWRSFCEAVGRTDLIEDQFAEGERREEIIREVQAIFEMKTRLEWVEYLRDIDCCCEPVNSFDEVFSHPQVLSREIVGEIYHSTEGTIRQLKFPGKMSGTPGNLRTPPPSRGEHTDEILRELGLAEEGMIKLQE